MLYKIKKSNINTIYNTEINTTVCEWALSIHYHKIHSFPIYF